MCLAIPARVIELRGDMATVDMEGIRREVNVLLVPGIKTGEYVIVHAGFAIGKLDEHEALDSLRLIRQVLGSQPERGEEQEEREQQEKEQRREKLGEQGKQGKRERQEKQGKQEKQKRQENQGKLEKQQKRNEQRQAP